MRFLVQWDPTQAVARDSWMPLLRRSAAKYGLELFEIPYSSNEPYGVMNRSMAYTHVPPSNELLVIIEADMLFSRTPLEETSLTAQFYGYMERGVPEYIKRWGPAQPIGVPYYITAAQLHEIAPSWVEWTRKCYAAEAHWISDMYSFSYAAQELGISVSSKLGLLSHIIEYEVHPIVHYCHPIPTAEGQWSKYYDWHRLPKPSPETPDCGKWFLEYRRNEDAVDSSQVG